MASRHLKRAALLPLLLGIGPGLGCQSDDAAATVPPPALSAPRVVRASATPPPPRVHLTSPNTNYSYNRAPNPYAYLSPRPSSAIPRTWVPAVRPESWRYIVIHHSDTANGSAAAFDRYHRTVRHWDSLGYHFVIGNGSQSGNGEVEVGPRWRKQEWGAHAGVEEYNRDGIGICLVGDFDVTRPSAAQMQSMARLVGYLMRTYRIPASHVIGHRDFRSTNCPGKYMNLAVVRQMASQYAEAPIEFPMDTRLAYTADVELLHDVR